MKNIEKIIVKSIKSVEGREKYAVHYLDWHWSEVLGENIAKHSKPAKIVNGVLFINTDNPAWSHSLLMMKNKVLAKIVTLIKESSHKVVIKDIRFFNGSVKRFEVEKYIDPYTLPEVTLLEEDEKLVKEEVSILKDEKLRNSFEKLMLSDKRRKIAMKTKYKNNCKLCGVPIRTDEKYCVHCEKIRLAEIKNKIAELLRSIPWLNYQDCLNYVNCDRITFDEVKGNMINIFSEAISDYRCSEEKKAFATMIINNLKPDEVDEETIHRTAEKLEGEKLMFVHLGADCIVKSSDIIAIFNLNSPDSNIYKKFIKNNEDKYEIVDVTEDGIYYSCVLTEKKIYLSAISSLTLYKRKVDNFLTNGGIYD